MRHFFSRNLITLSVAIAGLMALSVGIFLTLESIDSRQHTQRLQQSNRIVDTLLQMSEYQALERGLTAAYLGGADEASRKEIERLRSRVDRKWRQALELLEKTSVAANSGATLTLHKQRARSRWKTFQTARERVDAAAESDDPIGGREWFDIATASIASVATLRDRLMLVADMPPDIARLNLEHKHAVWLISEHTGRIRGLLAFYAAGRTPLPPAARQQIAEDRMVIRNALTELLWLRQTDLMTPRLSQALDSLETRIRDEFHRELEAMLAAAGSGRYPVASLEWFTRATVTVDESLEVAGVISSITERRLSGIASSDLQLVQGFLGFAFLSGTLALLSLRRVRRNADALFHQKELAETTLHSIGDAVLTTDRQGRIDYMNPLAEEMTGWNLSDAKGRPSYEVLKLHNTLHASMTDPVRECLREGQVVSLTSGHVLIRRDGRQFSVEDSAAPIRARDASVVGAVVVFYDTDSSQKSDHLLAYHSTRDALTGLINRREFDRRLLELLRRAREDGEHHVLAYLDLDQFKVVNDTCGHEAGDRMLRQVTFMLRKSVRDSDTLARLGGDEFAMLLQNTTLEQAAPRLDDLRRSIRSFCFSSDGRNFTTSLSIGAVPIDPASTTASRLLSEADAACYAAKEKGRNRVQFFQADDTELSQRRGEMNWVTEITDALQDHRLELFCQRLAPLRADLPEHREILVRLRDPQGRLVPPMAFIPAAERYNLIGDIDRWVIARTCRQLARHAPHDDGTVYHINLSGLSLSDSELATFIRNTTRDRGIAPRRLCFEITETAAVTSLEATCELINELRGEGFAFALDDFGSGLSSFTYLKTLPVQQIKIDGVFVRNMLHDPLDRAMVKSVVDIAGVLGIDVCAEFVETEELLARLRELGVDHAQGFAVEVPGALSEVLR